MDTVVVCAVLKGYKAPIRAIFIDETCFNYYFNIVEPPQVEIFNPQMLIFSGLNRIQLILARYSQF